MKELKENENLEELVEELESKEEFWGCGGNYCRTNESH